jgi:hypothetical protein
MALSKLLLFFCLALLACSLPEFKTKQSRDMCLSLCSLSVSTCLNVDPACSQAYNYCLSQANFVTCLQSANGIYMQEIVKCMESNCFRNSIE